MKNALIVIDIQNDYFEKNCDFTVSNEGTEESFKIKCEEVFKGVIRR